ncbi:hypothetical protein SDJN02_18611, partial [Cucurbita argyrosperma subsp. argyrosperma]
MSYLSRACMAAASVAVVEGGHADHFSKWNSETLFRSKRRFQNEDTASQELGAGSTGIGKDGEKVVKAEDSLHKVMYLNCWTQS